MNAEIEQLIGRIAEEASKRAPDGAGRILVYGEAKDGVSMGDVIWEERGGKLTCDAGPDPLPDDVYELWEAWSKVQPEWRAFVLLIEGGEFEYRFIYPDDFDNSAGILRRRQAEVQRVFGTTEMQFL